jgi:hypothetical protein
MTRRRKGKEVKRCVVCGMKASRYIDIGRHEHSMVCSNVVCFHTRLDEVKNELMKENECHEL